MNEQQHAEKLTGYLIRLEVFSQHQSRKLGFENGLKLSKTVKIIKNEGKYYLGLISKKQKLDSRNLLQSCVSLFKKFPSVRGIFVA